MFQIIFWLTQISFALTAQKYILALTLMSVQNDSHTSSQIGFVLIALDVIFVFFALVSIVLIFILLRQVTSHHALSKSKSKVHSKGKMKKKGTVKKSEASQILHDFVNTDTNFKTGLQKKKNKHNDVTMQRVIARRRIQQTKALHKVPAFANLPKISLDKLVKKMKYLVNPHICKCCECC